MEETRPLDRSVAQVDAALPIALVTLMEDRAQIERRGTVELGCGTTWVIVRDVAPAASDKSLAVRLGSPDGVRVADARLRRITRVLERDRPASTAQLDREIEELGHREAELAQRQSSLESRRALLEKVGDSTLADLAQDAAWGRAATDDLSGRLRELDRQIAELCERSLTLAAQREDLQLALRDLVRLRASQETPACRRTAQLEIQLISSAAGPVEITVLYVVPGACWRPHHSARLRAGRVFFETEGCVWQNTGEDWADVELVFSTQRESLGHEPPLLADDELRARPKPKDEIVEAREQTVQTTGLGGEPRQTRAELPGIDDAGQVQNLRSGVRSAVPSDGRPYRIPIGRFESEASSELIAMPEVARTAFLRTEQTNGGAVPILAGPVDLIRDSGYVGRTTVLYVAPGERFELGWGPDPEVRLNRFDDRTVEEPGLLGAWTTIDHRIKIWLSHLGAEPRKLKVRERVPVSEVEKVKVEFDGAHTSPGTVTPDQNGFVTWELGLKPRSRQQLELRYVLKRHKDVTGV